MRCSSSFRRLVARERNVSIALRGIEMLRAGVNTVEDRMAPGGPPSSAGDFFQALSQESYRADPARA